MHTLRIPLIHTTHTHTHTHTRTHTHKVFFDHLPLYRFTGVRVTLFVSKVLPDVNQYFESSVSYRMWFVYV